LLNSRDIVKRRLWIIVAFLALPLAWLFWTGSDAYVVSRSRAIKLGQNFEQVEAAMSGIRRMVLAQTPTPDYRYTRIHYGGSKFKESLSRQIGLWFHRGYSIPPGPVEVEFGPDARICWIRRGEDSEGEWVEFPRRIFREAVGGP
jgi:hypothetical protein